MSVTPSQFELLSKMMDVTAMRHHVLSHNVANVNTPEFQRNYIEFEDALAEHFASGKGEDELADVQPVMKTDVLGPMRVDGSNVDIGTEMGRLNKNSLLHNAYVQILTSKVGTMRRSITGSRG